MMPAIRLPLFVLLFAMLSIGSGCAVVKVVVTPLTVVRDIVDAPLVSLSCGTQYFAQQSRIARAPSAGVGWSLSGPTLGIGYDLSYFLFTGLSGIFGGVDYVVCRSLYPNFARGVSPWRKKGQSWGSLYFPNTRVLWGDERPIHRAPDKGESPPS